MSDSIPTPERRAAQRIRTLMSGRVYYHAARPALDCHVRNLSSSGACLKGDGVADAPDRFRLEIPSRNRLHGVYVRWRKEDRIGVGFESTVGAPHTLDP